MGQSAWRYALDMKDMIKKAGATRDGKSDADLIANILATETSLAKDWKADTCHLDEICGALALILFPT